MSTPSSKQPQPSWPTPERLRANFEEILAGIRAGEIGGVPSHSGMDDQTTEALEELAQLHTRGLDTTAAVYDVRAEFERQLDGTHGRDSWAHMTELMERGNRGT